MGDPPTTSTTQNANPTTSPSSSDPPPEIDLTKPPFPLTAIDRALLATPDHEFHRLNWPDLRRVIADNKLEELKRLPSDLKRYLAWSHDIKSRYGSITNFVIQERLGWTPLSRKEEGETGPPKFEHDNPTPFADERDFAVLPNDWPYGLSPGIVHLLVWTKTPIPVDAEKGDVTPESRRLIVEFVERHFVKDLEAEGGWERVLWFKNWVSLQSVRGVDHVHVLVRDAPGELLERWTRRRDL